MNLQEKVNNFNPFQKSTKNNNMKHLFIPYNLALLAKEKGFDGRCLAGYENEVFTLYKDENMSGWCNRNLPEGEITAPLYQQLVDWFRENHGKNISIDPYYYPFYSKDISIKGIIVVKGYTEKEAFGSTYYEALNKAFEEAFKLI